MHEILNQMIENGFSPGEISAIVIIGQHTPINHEKVVRYLHQWPLADSIAERLHAFGFVTVLPGEQMTILNARIAPKYTPETKSNLMEMAEELWDTYPATFPLGEGVFLARKGGDKHEILRMYLERIKNSREKHAFVMKQLPKYVKMVMNRKINGHRIQEWVSNEMWDTISSLDDVVVSNFKTDI